MAKISPEQFFNKNDLHGYTICCKFYPKLMHFFGFDANVKCVVKNDHMPNYFYLKVKGFNCEVKLFSSLSLMDFYGKLVLLNDVKDYMTNNNCSLTEAIRHLLDNNVRFYVIEQDIDDMIGLKAIDELEFVEISDTDVGNNCFDDQGWSSAKNNKTVH